MELIQLKQNPVINSFIESKRLELGKKKSNRLHIGKKNHSCYELKVHESKMNDTKQEKYIGDIIRDDGKNTSNIAARKAKGFGISGDITAILSEIPFGKHKIEAGLYMRNGMLINGMLTNAETWYGLTNDEMRELECVDEFLLRKILQGHSKTPLELLYLETGAIPIRYIIKARRLTYLRNILSRDKNELISRVYFGQKRKPLKDDWYLTVKNDLEELNIQLSENELIRMPKNKFKKFLRAKISEAAFKYLQKLGSDHKQDQGSKAPSSVHYITVKALTKLSSKLLHTYNFLP